MYWVFLYDTDGMTKEEIADYLYFEYNVLSPKELDIHDRISVYERLRFQLLNDSKPAIDIAKDLVTLNEYLEL